MNLFKVKDMPQAPLAASAPDDKFKAIIDGIEEGVVMVDAGQVVQLINPSAAVLCGWPVDEATGINATSVLQLVNEKGEAVADAENPLRQVFQMGQSVRGKDMFLLTRDQKHIPISLSISPLLDENKQVGAAVAVFNDVSDERAEQKRRADFISTASHEMRTPVAAIEGYLELCMNEKMATVDARARQYLEKAYNSTQHLGQLLQDLLTSAKAEDGRIISHPTAVELGDFIEKLTDDLRLVAEKKGLFVDFITSNDPTHAEKTENGGERVIMPLYYVYADPDRLREVLTNLFDNAVKYTPKGRISFGLTGDDHTVQCYVKDTGIGIPTDDVPHLFQKFYRVDNSETRTIGGTGLGLFICRKIIELYGGNMWVESELGKGSAFYINLPRLSAQKAAQLQADASNPNVVKPANTDTIKSS